MRASYVLPVASDNLGGSAEVSLVDLNGGRVVPIDEQKYLDFRIEQLVELAVWILPACIGIRLDRQLNEPIIVQLGISIYRPKIGVPIAIVPPDAIIWFSRGELKM
jgi:hypothetical protein